MKQTFKSSSASFEHNQTDGFLLFVFSFLSFVTQEVSEEKYGVNIVVSFFNIYFALTPAKLKSRKIVVKKNAVTEILLCFTKVFNILRDGKPKSSWNLKFSPNFSNAVCFKANGIHDKENNIPCSKLILHLFILEFALLLGVATMHSKCTKFKSIDKGVTRSDHNVIISNIDSVTLHEFRSIDHSSHR